MDIQVGLQSGGLCKFHSTCQPTPQEKHHQKERYEDRGELHDETGYLVFKEQDTMHRGASPITDEKEGKKIK